MPEQKFLVDFMLGRLARWLVIWGFDAEYFTYPPKTKGQTPEELNLLNRENRKRIIYQSLQKSRVIVTRDTRLSAKKAYGLIRIKSSILNDQLKQFREETGLQFTKEKLYTRCSICNASLSQVEKESVKDKVPPFVYETQNEFSTCSICRRVYWPGTHLLLMEQDFRKMTDG